MTEEFVELIADMMEKDPDKRIQTAGEVASRLEPWASEESALPSQKLIKSPWMPPPLPTGSDDEALHETASGSFDDLQQSPSSEESASQVSQGTDPVASGSQETHSGVEPQRRVTPPPLPTQLVQHDARRELIVLALAIAIPISMLLGALPGFVVAKLV